MESSCLDASECPRPSFHGFVGGLHRGFHEADDEFVAHVGDADGARAHGQHLRVGDGEAEAEDDVDRCRHAFHDRAANLGRMGEVIKDADELDFRILGDLGPVVVNQRVDRAVSGFVLADLGDEDGVLFLKQRLFHAKSSMRMV